MACAKDCYQRGGLSCYAGKTQAHHQLVGSSSEPFKGMLELGLGLGLGEYLPASFLEHQAIKLSWPQTLQSPGTALYLCTIYPPRGSGTWPCYG